MPDPSIYKMSFVPRRAQQVKYVGCRNSKERKEFLKVSMDSNKSSSNRSDEYHPKSAWVYQRDHNILQVELPEFKKEELKVQIDHMGNLRISGEHRMNGSKPIRFRQSHRVPENSRHELTKAKFEQGVLYINVPLSKPQDQHLQENGKHQPHKQENPEASRVGDATLAASGKGETVTKLGTVNLRLKTRKGQIGPVVVGVLVLAALVGFFFMVYRLRGSVEEGDPPDFLDL